MNNDARRLRHGQADQSAALDQSIEDDEPANAAIVVATTAPPPGETYPVAALAFYPVVRQEVGGDEVAGHAVGLANLDGVFRAANIGSAIPPQGTVGLLARLVPDGSYVFTYNG